MIWWSGEKKFSILTPRSRPAGWLATQVCMFTHCTSVSGTLNTTLRTWCLSLREADHGQQALQAQSYLEVQVYSRGGKDGKVCWWKRSSQGCHIWGTWIANFKLAKLKICRFGRNSQIFPLYGMKTIKCEHIYKYNSVQIDPLAFINFSYLTSHSILKWPRRPCFPGQNYCLLR